MRRLKREKKQILSRNISAMLVISQKHNSLGSIINYYHSGFNKYDFWTSGNKLGTDMFLWMSTGLPFNATFNYMKKPGDVNAASISPDIPSGSTSPQRTARERFVFVVRFNAKLNN